jgi:hypothetical protein
LYYLREGYGYEQAMRDILSKRGDTDTNAAIIGMVLGARDGLEGLDQNWVKKVLSWNIKKGGHQRPAFLVPGVSFMQYFDQFFESIPKELVVEYGLTNN